MRTETTDIEALLDAIAKVASNNRPNKRGPRGEFTAFQFTKEMWEYHYPLSYYDFKEEDRPGIARVVAKKRLEWINEHLPDRFKNHPFWVGVWWKHMRQRCKKPFWTRRCVPRYTLPFADRVMIAYRNIKHRQLIEEREAKAKTTEPVRPEVAPV